MKKLDASSGLSTSFVYNGGGQLMEEYEGTTAPIKTQPTKEYVYGPSGMLAIVEGTDNSSNVGGGTETIQYLTPDHLGSPRLITKEDGTVINRRDFYPFGEEIGAGIGGRMALGYGTDSIKQRFTGYFRDNETGLDFAQARYYGAMLGRFMSPDPLGRSANLYIPQTWNRYSYVLNNPINDTDPLGLQGNGNGNGNGGIVETLKKAGKAVYNFYFSGPAKSAANTVIGINNLVVSQGYGSEEDYVQPYQPSNKVENASMSISDKVQIVGPLLGGFGSFGGAMADAEETSVVAGETSAAAAPKTPTIEPGNYSQSELDAAHYFGKQGADVTLRMPTGTRAGGGTSDLLVNGERVDVYTPTTSNGNRIISAIAKKNTQAETVFLDLRNSNVKVSELGDIVKRVQGAGAKNIKNVIVVGGKN